MPVTPADVHDVSFRKAPLFTRGYNTWQVDTFVDRITSTFEGSDNLTVADVHRASFDLAPIGRRGYDRAEVDAFLRLVESAIAERVHEALQSSAPYVAPALEHTHTRKALRKRRQH